MGEHAQDFIYDVLAEDGVYAYGRDYPTSIRCKRCGSGPFDWKRFGPWSDPKWRLVDDDGNMHVCPPPDPKKLFEDIS